MSSVPVALAAVAAAAADCCCHLQTGRTLRAAGDGPAVPHEPANPRARAPPGNIAHLLNHSCAPNCYSRTVSVRSGATGALADHVVIFARRAIAAGEELTYDYRCAPHACTCACS